MKCIIYAFALIVFASYCSLKYVTPGSDVKISSLADEDISKLLANKPASDFPVNIAIARIQHPQYTSYSYHRDHASGNAPGQNFSLILTRDAGEDEGLKKLYD